MKKILLIVFSFWAFPSAAQKCPRYEDAMKKGRNYFAAFKYDLALTEFLGAQIGARECELTTNEPAKEIRKLFDQVTKQRDMAEHAQGQTFKARIASLVNAAAGLKKTDPTIGRSLAVAAYSLLPSNSTASLLHDYLSDTSLNTYARFRKPFGMPAALDDREKTIYSARLNLIKYDLITDSLQQNFRYNDRFVSPIDISADGEVAAGYGPTGTDSSYIYIIFPKTGRIKLLTAFDRVILKMKLAFNKNAVVIQFSDSSVAVCDTNGKKWIDKPIHRNILSLGISCGGRYIAYINEWAGRKIRYLDCLQNKEDSTREHDNPINGFSFSNLKEAELFIGDGQSLRVISLSDGLITDSFDLGQEVDHIAPFNQSGKLACSTVDNNILLLSEKGKIIEHLSMDPVKKIIGLRVSSLDSSLLIATAYEETVVWKFEKMRDVIQTIPVGNKYVGYPRAILDSDKILVDRMDFNLEGSEKMDILLVNGKGETQVVLDSFDITEYPVALYMNYSERHKRLVLAGYNVIMVSDLSTGKRIKYEFEENWKLPNFAVSPDFKWIARVVGNAVSIYSATSKFKLTTFVVSTVDGVRVCFWKNGLLIGQGSKVFEYSLNGKRGALFTTLKESFGSRLFSSPDSKHVFIASYASMLSDFVTIYNESGYKLKTVKCPYVYSISMNKANNSFYVLSTQQIQEIKLPYYSIDRIPESTIEEKIKYQIPGAFEDILKSKDFFSLVEAAKFSLQNYYQTMETEDLQQFKDIIAKLPQSVSASKVDHLAAWVSLKNLWALFDEMPVPKKEVEIVDRLILKFSD